MTEQNISDVTDDDRRRAYEWAKSVEANLDTWGGRLSAPARVILAAIPAPAPPTLADMAPEERASCRWMQADVMNRRVRYVIANPFDDDNDAGLVSAEGEIEWFPSESVTPRPDLPRMAWPGTEKPSPSPALPEGWRFADHEEHGRVIVTNPTPDGYGTVYFAFPRVDYLNGFDWKFCDHDELTYIEQGADQ